MYALGQFLNKWAWALICVGLGIVILSYILPALFGAMTSLQLLVDAINQMNHSPLP